MQKTLKLAATPSRRTLQPLTAQAVPADFVPSQEQIEALARRLMPEIKKFFADEQVQKEFAAWKAREKRAA
jgi:hypothetical protein